MPPINILIVFIMSVMILKFAGQQIEFKWHEFLQVFKVQVFHTWEIY